LKTVIAVIEYYVKHGSTVIICALDIQQVITINYIYILQQNIHK